MSTAFTTLEFAEPRCRERSGGPRSPRPCARPDESGDSAARAAPLAFSGVEPTSSSPKGVQTPVQLTSRSFSSHQLPASAVAEAGAGSGSALTAGMVDVFDGKTSVTDQDGVSTAVPRGTETEGAAENE